MFDGPGIGVEDLAWIHRDQFVHYVQLAHALGDPTDWSRLRHDLLRALTAAFGLDAGMGDELTPRQHALCRSSTRSAVTTTPRPSGRSSSRPCGADGMTSPPTSLTEARCHSRRSPRATPS